MPRNIEIKAFAPKPLEDLIAIALDLSETKIQSHLKQVDTFYNCSNGRLKLRVLEENGVSSPSQLIFYKRSDISSPKGSDFWVVQQNDGEGLNELLSLAYGRAGRVEKKRVLIMVGKTRIHLDQVADLGEFVELEVLLEHSDDTDEEGMAVAHELMAQLGIQEKHLVAGSYMDMILAKQKRC